MVRMRIGRWRIREWCVGVGMEVDDTLGCYYALQSERLALSGRGVGVL